MVFKNLFEPLSPGDKIGIASVSGKTDPEKNIRGKMLLEQMGYSVVLSENLEDSFRYMSGTDEKRKEGLSNLLARKDIKGIIFARGGYGNLRILEKTDMSELKKFRGFFMGYSDNSILLNLISEKTENIVFHGPNLSELEKADPVILENLLKGKILENILEKPAFINSGKARGRLAGGNLATLSSLCGTVWLPDFKDKILFIEDVNEAPYKIDRMLTQMRLCGCFRGVKGVIAGSFKGCGDLSSVLEIILESFGGVPVVFSDCFGHGEVNNPLLIGGCVEVDSFGKRVCYV
jgi:muramoyltetrapeptide carboxypeptidase